MNRTEIQQWLESNTNHSAVAQTHFLALLGGLIDRGIEVKQIDLGEDGESDDFIVAHLIDPESENKVKIGFDGESDFTVYNYHHSDRFDTRHYSENPELSIQVTQAYVMDYLSENQYIAEMDDSFGERTELFKPSVVQAIASHINPFKPEFPRQDELIITHDEEGEIRIKWEDDERLIFAIERMSDDAMIVLNYLLETTYKNDQTLYPIIRYGSKAQRETCYAMFG